MSETEQSEETKAAVLAERKRCEQWVQAARCGDSDPDFRSIIYAIRSGEVFAKEDDDA